MGNAFLADLLVAISKKQSHCVVGLDPRLDMIPEEIKRAAAARAPAGSAEYVYNVLANFCCRLIDLVHPYAVAVKPQIAFFEQSGLAGVTAYHAAVTHARERGLLVIGDVKRGDIGSTAVAYAEGHLKRTGAGEPAAGFEADAITVNPLFGTDGIKPFLDVAAEQGKGLFILVKTSNPSSAEIQDLVSDGRPIYEHVARLVDRWGKSMPGEGPWSPLGAVVGATWPEAAARLRELMPRTIFLVPGYGAQGGTAKDLLPCFNAEGEGAIVNASRSIIFAWRRPEYADSFGESRWTEAVVAAARAMREEIEEAIQR